MWSLKPSTHYQFWCFLFFFFCFLTIHRLAECADRELVGCWFSSMLVQQKTAKQPASVGQGAIHAGHLARVYQALNTNYE